ncbi:extracellular solute-binding protein [Ameyamaea chiangmaiensis]|nr:extracellular solute-binding protein [Ameyamaea chiangmaiensis]MBS4075205.1 extracellular solute-binding protein [Ameyamaea chiangmaiensis]
MAALPWTPDSVARAATVSVQAASLDISLAAAQRDAIGQPFHAKSGIATRFTVWDGSPDTLRKVESRGGRRWTLVLMEDTSVPEACAADLMVHAFPGGGDTAAGCGWAALQVRTILAWDRGRLDTPPNWTDFWDVARHPGRRALRRDPRTTLEIALMADGVAPQDVYPLLATPTGVARAFRKLNQLRPYIVWWSTPDEAARILRSGSALMASIPQGAVPVPGVSSGVAPHGRSGTPAERSFGIQSTQSVAEGLSWGIVSGTPDRQVAQARELLAFADQTAVRGDLLSRYPALAHDATPDGVLQLDPVFWRANLAPLRKQFDAWLNAPS